MWFEIITEPLAYFLFFFPIILNPQTKCFGKNKKNLVISINKVEKNLKNILLR